MKSKYGLTGLDVLELIAKNLHPYKGKLQFDTKRELSNRNKILHVIRRIAGHTTFSTAWSFIRKGKVQRVYGQNANAKGQTGKPDRSKKLFFYYITRKKQKKEYIPRVLVFLPNVQHCTCRQYKMLFKKKRYVTLCSHLLAILLAKSLDLFLGDDKFINDETIKLILHARMKKYEFNTVNFHKIIMGRFKITSLKQRQPKKKKVTKKKKMATKKNKKLTMKKKVKKMKKVKK